MTTAPDPDGRSLPVSSDVRPASGQTVRRHNLGLVLEQVGAATTPADPTAGITRTRLAAATGLTKSTVSALVDELIGRRLVVELQQSRGGRGRPSSPVRLDRDGPSGLGLEINVDYIRAVVVDLAGEIRARRTDVRDNRASTPAATLRRTAALSRAVAAEARCGTPAGVMLAVPGLIDGAGELVRAPNLPAWTGRRVGADLARRVPWPVRIDNEANLSALAELRYGAEHRRDFVLVSGEIGVGSGIVLAGQLFRGVRGFAGELGHVFVDPAGGVCSCGAPGCLEQVAGQDALLGAGPGGIAELAGRAERGDPAAVQVLARAGRALGVALAGVVNVLDVPTVVLGGRYAELGAALRPAITAELAHRVVAPGAVEVAVSDLGADAAALGAAGTVIDSVRAGAALG